MNDDRIKLDMPVIVEGRYDKIKLQSVIDAIIITTDGFGIYRNRKKRDMIRKYAEKTGIIILTDSDGAGFQIRNSLKGCIGSGKAINIYIPDVFGKERRKAKPSKEGKLGVEGIDTATLRKAFEDAGVMSSPAPRVPWIDKQRLVDDGLSGGDNSSGRRKALCVKLGLPERMSAKALLEALNALYSKEEYEAALNAVCESGLTTDS
jgi:ribonuclease M5